MLRYLIACILLIAPAARAELQVHDAWIAHLPPPVMVRAGYMSLHNSAAESVTIESISSDAFTSIEIHRSVEQDGLMTMHPVPSLTVKANSSVQLSPGGLHLMMMGPVAATAPGDLIDITIKFAGGAEQTLGMIVKQ